jgi:heat shock protein HslJ
MRKLLMTLLALLLGSAWAQFAVSASSPQDGSDTLAAPGELAGTAWRLVKILSMDDSVYTPDDPARYTLEFTPDGNVRILADCNRGMGSWRSEQPGQLAFGRIASTRALCPPGSLSEKYLAQFQWVRSYTMKDAHLFLATMADGSIIEFEPLPPKVATVLGDSVRSNNAREMQAIIITQLFDRYAAENGIVAEASEIARWIDVLEKGKRAAGLTAAENLTPEEAEELKKMQHEMGRSMIRQWKINRALHEQYGGRIIAQQLGPEPLDAYRLFLQEQQKAGAFKIGNAEFEKAFWRYFTDESIHTFYPAGSDEEATAFSVPPWQRTGPDN